MGDFNPILVKRGAYIMKKMAYLSIIILLLASCTIPMNMNTVVKEPNFGGIVEEVHEKSILVRVNEDEITSSDLISVSLDVELKDSMTDFNPGDEIRVYFDGNIAESYPAQVHKVYAIILVEPADRAEGMDLETTDNKVIDDFEGVSITVKDRTISSKGLILILENKSDKQIIYGEDFLLEQRIDGGWHKVPISIDGEYGFNDIGYELNPGEDGEWEVDWDWLYGGLKIRHAFS